ncbi:MAG: hypothetical protein AUJ92_00710 [Armatimonadetes bacterium CG2_30_59_28]|nr:LamG domain-containing protein [Armatimonadota bacterium]OIO98820.1 MAG: hypothetical protein AUJ92_00710 [Armatimonadetes bacterium CG2_30_59_28]
MKLANPALICVTFIAGTGILTPVSVVAARGAATSWGGWTVPVNWQRDESWVGGAGDNLWSYATFGNEKRKDYAMECSLRIDTATERMEPKYEAGWVWTKYGNNAEVGGYEAGLVLRKQGDDFYRVMFSIPFQEVLLWSTRGGFLQVASFPLEVKKEYSVRAQCQGPHVTLAIDDKPVIDYWDRTCPILSGSVALGLHEGAAHFSSARVRQVPSVKGDAPPHKAAFHFRDWKGLKWAFDGSEPIFMYGGNCHGYDAKLVPGYKPQLSMYWYWINYGDESFYADKQTAFTVQEEAERLRFEISATDNKEKAWLTGKTAVTVTYDSLNNRYVYDHVSDLIIPDGHTLRLNHPVEFTDPVIHGHIGSASTQGEQWETPHPWSVYKHVSGKLYKLPHNHVSWYAGYGKPAWREAKGNYLDPKGGFWALVGDPVANPTFIVQDSSVKDSEFYTELCGWALDVHKRWYPVKPGGTLQPGTYTVKWQLTSVDGRQGNQWLQEAEICAPDDLDKRLLLYTGGVGHVERFDKAVKWANPFSEYPWGDASLQDTQVGRTDSTSLKLAGPRSAGATVGASNYSEPVLEDTLYEVSAWVKTDGVVGEGPGLRFGGQEYFPGVTGTRDWQRIGFVCKPNPPLYIVPFGATNSGAGTVWFDDFLIRPVAKDEKPETPIASAPVPINLAGASPERLLQWNSASDAQDAGRTLLDLSKHGNHGRLEGSATIMEEGGIRVIEVDGIQGYVTTDRSFAFSPPLTLTLWVKPGKLEHDWNMIATGGAWNRAWNLFLFYKQAPYSIDFRPWGKRIFTEGVVPPDQWSHLAVVDDGKTVVIYLNGNVVKTESSAGRNWAAVDGPLVLGTSIHYDEPKNGLAGRLAGVTLWSKSLDKAAVKDLFEKGVE